MRCDRNSLLSCRIYSTAVVTGAAFLSICYVCRACFFFDHFEMCNRKSDTFILSAWFQVRSCLIRLRRSAHTFNELFLYLNISLQAPAYQLLARKYLIICQSSGNLLSKRIVPTELSAHLNSLLLRVRSPKFIRLLSLVLLADSSE